jgi:hypothetical protein
MTRKERGMVPSVRRRMRRRRKMLKKRRIFLASVRRSCCRPLNCRPPGGPIVCVRCGYKPWIVPGATPPSPLIASWGLAQGTAPSLIF